METLVVARHRDEYHGRSSRNGVMGRKVSGAFGSSASNGFNCRTFHTGTGILPTPMRTCSTPVTKRALSPPFSPKTPSSYVNSVHSEPKKQSKKVGLSSCSVMIPADFKQGGGPKEPFGPFGDDFLYSELWAGPAYSNSPPPSSLPIPKFSVVRPKRTASLELPSVSACEIDLRPLAKSAPTSPTREHAFTQRDFFNSDESATKTLCRILNLDLTDA